MDSQVLATSGLSKMDEAATKLDRLFVHLLNVRTPILSAHTRSYSEGIEAAEEIVPTARLISLRKGEVLYRHENRELRLGKEALWFVPAWSQRSWIALRNCELQWIELATPLGGDVLPLITITGRSWRSTFLRLFRQIHYPLLVEVDLKAILAHMLHSGTRYEKKRAPRPEETSFREAVEYLRRNLHCPHVLTSLAGHLSLSSGRTRARFRALLGTSPGRYLEQMRMRHARHLLYTTQLPVKEIAVRSGFEDPLYFSRRYHRFWGHPPTEHRSPNP